MNTKIIIYILFVSLAFSCQPKEAFLFPVDESKLVISSPVINGMFSRSFKEDFVTINPDNVPASNKKDHFSLRQASALKDPILLAEKYVEVKPLLLRISQENDVSDYSLIQGIALRYLRNHFLNQEEANHEEILFLTNLLLKHQAIDLDVLVDGYLAIKSNIAIEEQEKFERYITRVYNNTRLTLKSDFEKAKSDYENSINSKEATGAALSGKLVERSFLSCEYAKDMLGL